MRVAKNEMFSFRQKSYVNRLSNVHKIVDHLKKTYSLYSFDRKILLALCGNNKSIYVKQKDNFRSL